MTDHPRGPSTKAAGRSLKLRLMLFLYSNANLGGCALALLGPVLLFGGVIGPGWLLITAGLYATGWTLGWTRRAPEVERRIEDTLTTEQTLEKLDHLVDSVHPHLSTEMNAHLASVRTSVSEVLPRLVGTTGHDANLFTVRETVLRYLPETLSNYVRLPPAFRTTHVLKEGRTARQLLADQLALLDAKMHEVVVNVAAADAQALLANGQFLEMKFRQADFLLP
ncbi:MAG: hypothetical protein V4739_07880 [Pseudomonadota bacterium]